MGLGNSVRVRLIVGVRKAKAEILARFNYGTGTDGIDFPGGSDRWNCVGAGETFGLVHRCRNSGE